MGKERGTSLSALKLVSTKITLGKVLSNLEESLKLSIRVRRLLMLLLLNLKIEFIRVGFWKSKLFVLITIKLLEANRAGIKYKRESLFINYLLF